MKLHKFRRRIFAGLSLLLVSGQVFATELEPYFDDVNLSGDTNVLAEIPDEYFFLYDEEPQWVPEVEEVPDVEVVPEVEEVPQVEEPVFEGFRDVSEGDWYKTYVDYVTDRGLIDGAGEWFYPNGNSSRGTIAMAFAVMSGADLDSLPPSYLTDVAGTEFEKGIVWCMQNGVMNGLSGTEFGTHAALSREQFAVALLGFANYQNAKFVPYGSYKSYFYDSYAISSWANVAMTWAVENGLFTGNNGYLSPNGFVTRGELAALLYRYDTMWKPNYYDRYALVDYAYTYLGYPYVEGGTTPAGFDCAGFASYIYRTMGMDLPTTARALYSAGSAIDLSEAMPGDILFFGSYSHAAIYIGNSQYIHANTGTYDVEIWDFSHTYFKNNFAAARRYIW